MNIKDLFNSKKNTPSESPQDREMRMQQRQYDYSRVMKLFQTHSYISIKEVVGTPPDKYYITYHVDGLTQTGKSIEAKGEHTVEIALPERYPSEPPKARMVTTLFHPNVSVDRIDLKGIWTRETPLADCIVRIGELIAFQRYETDEPLNGEAAQWALRNKSLLPLSDVELGYGESEENFNAFLETKTDIEAPRVEPESDGEKTKAFDNDDELTETGAEMSPASDTVAIVQEEAAASPPHILQDAHDGETAAAKPGESVPKEEQRNENDRRNDPMPTQKIDDVRNAESGKEKILNRPVSAQISINEDSPVHPPEILQKLGVDAGNENNAEQRKSRIFKVEGARATASPDNQEIPKSLIPSPYLQSRYAQTPGGPYCPHCGSHVDDYANFCARCGSKLKIKSSSRVARIFFIVGMIAIPILIFEVGSVIFLLNKKMPPVSSSAPAAETVEPAALQPAMAPAPAAMEKKTVVRMEPAPALEKPVPAVAKKEPPVPAQESVKPVAAKVEASRPAPAATIIEAPKPAQAAVETPKPMPVKPEAPKPAPAAVEAPKPAPVAAETPKPMPVKPEAPKPAPVAAEAPKSAAAEAPKPAPAAAEAQTPLTGGARKKAAVDGYLGQSEGATPPPEISKNASANQSAVTDNLKLARLYMGIGSYDDAIARYRDVVKTDPYNQEAIQGLMQAKKMKAAMSGAK